MDYAADAAKQWPAWRLEVSGSVKQPGAIFVGRAKIDAVHEPRLLAMIVFRGLEYAIAKWKGVPLTEILQRAQPTPAARYVVFHCMDTDDSGTHYYESVDLRRSQSPQTILAYEMNDRRRAHVSTAHRCGCASRLNSATNTPSTSAGSVRRQLSDDRGG